MIFTIVKDGKVLYFPNGVWGRKSYVLIDSVKRYLKIVAWLGALLWFFTIVVLSFIDHWTVPMLLLLVTVLFMVFTSRLSSWLCRNCESVLVEESKTELLELSFQKFKTSQLALCCLVMPAICISQFFAIIGGLEDLIYESIITLVCALFSCLFIYVLVKRLK